MLIISSHLTNEPLLTASPVRLVVAWTCTLTCRPPPCYGAKNEKPLLFWLPSSCCCVTATRTAGAVL